MATEEAAPAATSSPAPPPAAPDASSAADKAADGAAASDEKPAAAASADKGGEEKAKGDAEAENAEGDDGLDLGGAFKDLSGAVGGAVSGASSFFRSNVLENEDLHSRVKDVGDSVKETAAELGETASGAWTSLRNKMAEKEVVNSVTNNVGRGWGWTMGAVGSLWEKAQDAVGEIIGDNDAQGAAGGAEEPRAVRCPNGKELTVKPNPSGACSYCGAKGTRYSCACVPGTNFEVCTKCFDKGAPEEADGDKDEADEPDPDVPDPMDPANLSALAKELGMSLGGDAKEAPSADASATEALPLPKVSAPATAATKAPTPESATEAKPKFKSSDDDDLFAELGM
mmetsp:Transcript_48808/g.116042  ORF Transcript_48808/g.116042 Transcript_48808/m.116042 type:complete len:342 (-) Transcript_48808:6-1031(-)